MKTKFTPGPWNTTWLVSDKPTIYAIGADIHQTLARLGEVDGVNGDVHRANAQLIAAAPEMYEALAALTDEVYRLSGFTMKPSTEVLMLTAMCALKKARGEI